MHIMVIENDEGAFPDSLHAGKEVVDKCLHYQVNLHYEFCTVHELVTNRDVKTAG